MESGLGTRRMVRRQCLGARRPGRARRKGLDRRQSPGAARKAGDIHTLLGGYDHAKTVDDAALAGVAAVAARGATTPGVIVEGAAAQDTVSA